MSFFLRCRNRNYKQHNKMATSLKVCSTVQIGKRTSLFTSLLKKGSLTIEAAIVIPIILFFFMNLLSAIKMIGIQSNLMTAFHQVGKEMAIQGYLYDKAPIKDNEVSWISSMLIGNVYVKDRIKNHIGKEKLDNSLLIKGSKGINYIHTEIMKDDIIDIIGIYQVSPFFSEIPIFRIKMMNRSRLRGWTGYDNTLHSEQEEKDSTSQDTKNVYITNTGEVYHTNRGCTHIRLSITASNIEAIKTIRNQSGGKYKPCDSCEIKGTIKVYITKNGQRYHSSTSCHSLKRTIKEIPLSQVKEKPLCTRCSEI